jgi:hypothetical protein
MEIAGGICVMLNDVTFAPYDLNKKSLRQAAGIFYSQYDHS